MLSAAAILSIADICPGSRAFIHAQCQVSVTAHANCSAVRSEMLLRADRQAQGSIYLYSPGMSAEDRALTGVTMVEDSLSAAVQASVARHSAGTGGDGAGYRVAVIPEGPYLIPQSTE